MKELIKYTSDEVLQIIIDFYDFQILHDSEVIESKLKLTSSTTIILWRSICNLENADLLAKSYSIFFKIENNSELRDLLFNQEKNTLGDLCNHISNNADRDVITLTKSIGGEICNEASIFKTIKMRLTERKIDTTEFTPNTSFSSFFSKYPVELLEVISKLTPGVLRRSINGLENQPKRFSLFRKRSTLSNSYKFGTIRDLILEMNNNITW